MDLLPAAVKSWLYKIYFVTFSRSVFGLPQLARYRIKSKTKTIPYPIRIIQAQRQGISQNSWSCWLTTLGYPEYTTPAIGPHSIIVVLSYSFRVFSSK